MMSIDILIEFRAFQGYSELMVKYHLRLINWTDTHETNINKRNI